MLGMCILPGLAQGSRIMVSAKAKLAAEVSNDVHD